MTRCRTLFDGPVRVEYGQMYVMSQPDFPQDPSSGTEGQLNGLCGSRLPGFLFLTTATHTGTVPVTAELWDGEPPLDASWDDVFEASFEPLSAEVALVQWAGEARFPLALPRGRYAVRYSAAEMDAAREAEMADGTPPDRYLLQFWPSDAVGTDRVLREGSQFARVSRAHSASPPPPGVLARVDPELHAAVAAAPTMRRNRAFIHAARAAAAADVGNDPAVVAALDLALRAGGSDEAVLTLVPVSARLRCDTSGKPVADNPSWRRLQAGTALTTLLQPARDEGSDYLRWEGLYHCANALGEDRWRRTRAELLRTLRY